jgi:hypothetical protein
MIDHPEDDGFVRLTSPPPVRLCVTLRHFHSSLLEHAGVSFVSGVEVDPSARAEVAGTTLRIGETAVVWDLRLDEPAQGGGAFFAARRDGSLRSHLDTVAGTQSVGVTLECAGREVSAQVVFTEPWRWGWTGGLLSPLAALVLPNDGIVRQLAHAARKGGPPGDPAIPKALLQTLQDPFRIDYAEPTMESIPDLPPLQRLRAPHRVVFDIRTGRGEANCIDLVLLLAGVLEAAGHAPILIFLSDAAGRPAHAILGWWRDRSRRFRPELDVDDLRRRVASGEVDLLETTRACSGRTASYSQAREEARARLSGALSATGVDVLANRPPIGALPPFETAFDAAVLAAVELSESAARGAGSTVVETLHLLTGLLRAGGPIAERLLAAARLDRDALADLCAEEAVARVRTDRAGRTRGYQRCLDDARANAQSQGSTVVRESDVWWAALLGGSGSLAGVDRRQPEARRKLLAALEEIVPSSRPGSTLV